MERVAKYVLTALICAVAAGQFVQVITRYVLQVPVMGMDEAMLYPTMWLYILGSVNASRENSHIRANVLEIFLKTPRQHTILAIVADALSLIIGLWLMSWAWSFSEYSWRVWRTSATLYLPTFYADISLVLGMGLMMLFTLIQLGRHVRVLRHPELMTDEAQHG
ncbi:TRAP transporter small permease [Acidimangrovimonas sediminis]|uniref:TRAP transporter small permease n=1 Tax=Acidimangrovimonas sediminis TaxID=2056283 RepID=UPI000C80DEFC|nr:TRAP transporter small permease subunit [Acidimangrovimonas sediminis]